MQKKHDVDEHNLRVFDYAANILCVSNVESAILMK